MQAQFNILSADESAVALLQKTLGVPHFIATVLANRGVTTPEKARAFLNPSLESDWGNPYRIPGLKDVVDGLQLAVKDHKKILVFGDFDVDGLSATTVLTRGLRMLGSEVIPFVPRRGDEGYGLSEAAINRLMKHTPDVVVTVDCGIASKNEVKILQHRGVEVFITDHHEPANLVPEDVPVCDPKLDDTCPDSILAGVGVALKIIQALGGRFGQPHLWRELTDLASLGTVADLMPMRGENRALVRDGVERINANPRPCIRALLERAGAMNKKIEATSLSFSVIPRLNAAGRMGDATIGLELLLEDDYEKAVAKAATLESINDQRRSIEAELSEIASLEAQKIYHGQRALVVSGDGWHEGVKGIVASHLVRQYGVPTILFSIDGDIARGSGRSVGDVNLFKAVESCSDLLEQFGGHAAAVGITIKKENIDAFAKKLCAYMDTLSDECFHPRLSIDACVDLGELTMDNVERLSMLAPFGQENRSPRFLAKNVMVSRARAVGADKNHLSCVLTDGRHSVSGIMFHCGQISELMQCGSVVNAAFELQIDEWRGRRSVKAMLVSIAPLEPCPLMKACLNASDQAFMSEMYSTDDDEISQDDECEDSENMREQACEQNRAAWETRAVKDPEGLRQAVVEASIGKGAHLHKAQRETVDALDKNISTLSIMATGRGKSLIFQIHAVKTALVDHKASLLVFPLRALIADQAYHLNQALARFGMTCEILTGESTPAHRKRVFEALASGGCDIVLTTPEFLSFHINEFAQSGNIGFLVVDEAHHIGQAKAGNRPAYAHMHTSVEALGHPTVLAVTATANDQVAHDIEQVLDIHHVVTDATGRDNIAIDDRRCLHGRDAYLANLVASGEKTIIYVNSRQQTVNLARVLRKQVPQMALMVGFYNAGLRRSERSRVERMFRTGQLEVLVSTSAFGEGVDIPDIRHVVLYHMPFNDIEFNQMSGRVGRDGHPCTVHLLFNKADAFHDDRILRRSTPDHDTMAQVYRTIRRIQKTTHAPVNISDTDIALQASQTFPVSSVACESVTSALSVFNELGLITTFVPRGEDARRQITIPDDVQKVELTDSVRYREGVDELDVFHDFSHWVLRATASQLKDHICHPILPHESSDRDER